MAQYLVGYGRNESARENNIGEATVTDILNRWKTGVDVAADTTNSESITLTDYES
jgi:transposase